MVIMESAINQAGFPKDPGTSARFGRGIWLVLMAKAMLAVLSCTELRAQTVLYSIGEPSGEEQLSLELINRARLDPAGEGLRLELQAQSDVSVISDVRAFGTSLSRMKSEMAAIAPSQPLSFNADLINIARMHNDNMLASDRQTHFSTSSSKHFFNRMDDNGYVWSEAGENTFASTLDAADSHASFEIDWGSGSYGMQSGRTHRVVMHDPDYREAGVGFLVASASNVGPALLTQNYGERISRSTIKPYVTGVAIYDADGDGFYDIGEGISGVKVHVEKVSDGNRTMEDHYAFTSGSGGYSVPLDGGAGDYEVTFTLPGGATKVIPVVITSEIHTQYNPDWERGFNEKVDLILNENTTPPYTPPVFSGSTVVGELERIDIDFVDVLGATEYEVLVGRVIESPTEQDAEPGAPVTTIKSSSYGLIDVPSNQGDRLAFHLTHPNSSSQHQSMELDRVFVPGPSAEISFDSRLRKTGTAQFASLQVTTDFGRTWEDVWFRHTDNNLNNGFTRRTVDVSRFEGRPVKFRFFYHLGGGSVDYGTSSTQGWHFDDIGFAGMSELVDRTRTVIATGEYSFTPTTTDDYHVQVRARTGADWMRFAEAATFEQTLNDYPAWVARHERISGVSAGVLADASEDFDGDGISHLTEYALEAAGLNPTLADPGKIPAAVIEGDFLCLHYEVDTSLRDVSVVIEVSTGLNRWYRPGEAGAPAGFSDVPDADQPGGTIEARTASVPLAGHDALFMRIRVSEVAAP